MDSDFESGKKYAKEEIDILIKTIKRLKSEIKLCEEEVKVMCKKYGISVILD